MSNEADYYDQYVDISPEDYIRETQLHHPEQVERSEKIIGSFPADASSVLDVGCGGGIALHRLLQARPDLKAVGLERSAPTAQAARSLFGLEIVEGSADQLPFADDQFDVVMANEVLEHLPWGVFEKTISEMTRVARVCVLITTPYAEDRHFVTCPQCACDFNPFYHLRSFDETTLRGLFPGFEAISQEVVWTKGHTPLLYRMRRLKAALGWVPNLPQHTICPQCGYRHERKRRTTDAAPVAPPSERGLGRLMVKTLSLIPRPRRAKWALVLYRRSAN